MHKGVFGKALCLPLNFVVKLKLLFKKIIFKKKFKVSLYTLIQPTEVFPLEDHGLSSSPSAHLVDC